MRKLTIVYHHAGGGHRSAADALQTTLSAQEHPWDVSLLDIQELLDPIDLIRRATGLRIQDTYNLILRRSWTRFTPQLLVILQATIRLYHRPIVKALRAYWAQHQVDLVLSVIPHFNREIADSLRSDGARTPFVTLITDLADYPPHFWIERESEYIIAGTERARQQALTIGLPEDHIFLTSGMILKPRFYEKTIVDRADFFIGKPGPGSISEALQFHLPVIVECNSGTLPQERYNAKWVTEKGYGIVVPSFKKIAPAVQRLLATATFNEFRLKANQYRNRALFEVPTILEECAKQTKAANKSQAAV